MTAATMFVYHRGFDLDDLLFACGGACVDPANESLFINGRVFTFKDGSALKILDGVVWTAGKKREWRRHSLD